MIFIEILEECNELITEFDDELFVNLVDKIIIKPTEQLKLYFKDGIIVEVTM